MKAYKVMLAWCVFGGAMGYTAAQFLPFIKFVRQSPNLKRNRMLMFTAFTVGCSYHGYKKCEQVKKIGQRRLARDPRFIIQEGEESSEN